MLFLQGYDSDFLDNTPEAMAIREVQTNLLMEAEAEQKRLDELAEQLEKEEDVVEEEKPKKTTKRTTRKTSAAAKKKEDEEAK